MLDEEQVTPRRARRRRHRRRRRRFFSFIAVVLSMAVVAAALAGLYVGGRSVLGDMFAPPPDYAGPGTGEVMVTVPEGTTIRGIGALLVEAGVVASEQAFVDAAEGETLQAGDYVLREEMKAADAVATMLDSTTVVARVTVREGLRERQIVEYLAKETDFGVKQIRAAVDAGKLPDYAEGDAEGFLFPATYDLRPDTTPDSLVAAMIDRFNQAAETVGLKSGAADLDLTPRQAVTVASIIEREVARAEDMTKVSRVVYNRLSGACSAAGIPKGRLQMDSTVHYAADDYSSVFTSDELRQIKSPYNTYLHDGLPPGPIAAPGEAALQAALSPDEGSWCYFTAVNLETGETKFAETPEEHQANVAELQVWCRDTETDLC